MFALQCDCNQPSKMNLTYKVCYFAKEPSFRSIPWDFHLKCCHENKKMLTPQHKIVLELFDAQTSSVTTLLVRWKVLLSEMSHQNPLYIQVIEVCSSVNSSRGFIFFCACSTTKQSCCGLGACFTSSDHTLCWHRYCKPRHLDIYILNK